MCPGVDSASKNEYQLIPEGKGGRYVRLTTYHFHVPMSINLGTLSSCGPVQVCKWDSYLFTAQTSDSALRTSDRATACQCYILTVKRYPMHGICSIMLLVQGCRNYCTRAQNGTRHSLLSQLRFTFFARPNVSIFWLICVYTHIYDCVQTKWITVANKQHCIAKC